MSLAEDIDTLNRVASFRVSLHPDDSQAVFRILAIVTPLAGLTAVKAAFLADHCDGLMSAYAKEHTYGPRKSQSVSDRAKDVAEWEMRAEAFGALVAALKEVTP